MPPAGPTRATMHRLHSQRHSGYQRSQAEKTGRYCTHDNLSDARLSQHEKRNKAMDEMPGRVEASTRSATEVVIDECGGIEKGSTNMCLHGQLGVGLQPRLVCTIDRHAGAGLAKKSFSWTATARLKYLTDTEAQTSSRAARVQPRNSCRSRTHKTALPTPQTTACDEHSKESLNTGCRIYSSRQRSLAQRASYAVYCTKASANGPFAGRRDIASWTAVHLLPK